MKDKQIESEEAFEQFDWDRDENWQRWYSQVLPTPEAKKLETMKRRWFKIYHDINFDTNSTQTKDKDSEYRSERRRGLADNPNFNPRPNNAG